MNNSMICPICDKKIENYDIDMINHTMMEEHATCSDEYHFYGYTYEFGNSIETIGNIEFHEYWSQRLTGEDRKNFNTIYDLTVKLAREEYKRKTGL